MIKASVKIFVFLVFICLPVVILLLPYLNSSNTNKGIKEKLQNKLSELRELRGKLDRKNAELSGLIHEYESGIVTLSDEIKKEKTANNLDSYQQAIGNHKITCNLSLIQRRLAYIQKLQEINLRVKTGHDEIEFLERQAEDDIRMTTILDQKESREIMSNLIGVIKKYQPDSGKLIIDNTELNKNMKPQEEIWNDIMKQQSSAGATMITPVPTNQNTDSGRKIDSSNANLSSTVTNTSTPTRSNTIMIEGGSPDNINRSIHAQGKAHVKKKEVAQESESVIHGEEQFNVRMNSGSVAAGGPLPEGCIRITQPGSDGYIYQETVCGKTATPTPGSGVQY